MMMMMSNVLLFVATTLPSSSSSWSNFPPSSASVRRRATFTSDHDEKTPESSSHKQQQQQTMVIVDVENVRGATSFKLSHAALLSRICLWREDRSSTATSAMNYNDDDDDDASYYHSSPSLQCCNSIEPMIWACDHGIRPSIHHFSSSSSSCGDYNSIVYNDDDDVAEMKDERRIMPCNFGVTFAGPQRTADDVIVDIVKLRCQSTNDDDQEEENEEEKENGILDNNGNSNHNHNDDDDDRSIPPTNIAMRNTTVVITADAKLISRCQQSQRAGRSISDVIFVEPASLLMQLERYRINSYEEETFLGGSGGDDERQQQLSTYSSSGMRKKSEIGMVNVDGKTSTMTSTIAMEQHAKFQARFQSTLGLDELPRQQNEHDGEDDTVVDGNNYDDINETQFTNDDSSDDTSATALLAAQLKTEQIRRHLLLSDAYYLARPSKSVRGRGKAVVHVNYKDRNISKTQQRKLYTRRLGNQRKEDMALGATRRKENAARLQQILDNYNGGVDGVTDQNGQLISSSTMLLHMLLRQFECEKVSQLPNTSSSSSFDPTTVLGLDGTTNGAISKVKQLDPLNSIMKVPLRNNDAMSDTDLPPLRIVVISDTHGFEGALSKFIDSSSTDNNDDVGSPKWVRLGFSDDFILPPADVLIHCGDFAASGSRKTQRIAARRLDDFLARQTHIPEKIVIKGNHDPESPAKVLFPTSKALYVRSSSTVMIHGVSFALEPYSRRAISLQSSIGRRTYSTMPTLPECDILVSHEPPKGILDMTYHGFSAGSSYLRELVEHAEHKPRLWLCGHIHESRGVLEKHFYYPANRRNGGSDNIIDASTTMVINASNANCGKANRLVSGAVVVEIERRPSKTWREETAETTLRSSRRVGYEESVFDHIDNSSGGLARLGDDLELYTTRPGVRRRKGVAQSVRQQKVIRSTLLTS